MDYRILEKLGEKKLLPLYTATDLAYLKDLEGVLLENDLPLIEVTFRSDLAGTAIHRLAQSGRLIVGAGTVRTLAEAHEAVAAGAQFLVSPALVPEVCDYCKKEEILLLPGVATPSEIQQAVAMGFSVVKFFPAHVYGGLSAIQALSGPFYDVQFVPTGGIRKENYLDYAQHPQVLAMGGSFILSERMLKEEGRAATAQHLAGLVAGLSK